MESKAMANVARALVKPALMGGLGTLWTLTAVAVLHLV
jgi:hypothetical protein